MPYFRGRSTDYVFHFVGGKVRHQGPGATFWYWRFNSTFAAVPTNVQDASFVFQDITSDQQTVTCQGQFTFRFAHPDQAVKALNLTISQRTRAYEKNDIELLTQRLGNAVRVAASSELQSRDLATNLRNFQGLGSLVLERVRQDPMMTEAGIEIIGLFVLSVQPIPEIAKALEAEFREGLLKKADEAIYARRASSVDEERKIKEKELASQLALEAGKQELIERQGQNLIAEADSRGKALETEAHYKNDQLKSELDIWKQMDPSVIAALGFRLLGAKGATNLTITSEVLSALLQGKAPPPDVSR